MWIKHYRPHYIAFLNSNQKVRFLFAKKRPGGRGNFTQQLELLKIHLPVFPEKLIFVYHLIFELIHSL